MQSSYCRRKPCSVKDNPYSEPSAFANTNAASDPLEAAIARELWRWQSAAAAERAEITSPRSDLSLSLEFYFCGVFHLVDLARSHGWWCDGVHELSIVELSSTSFRVIGAADWAKSGNKPSLFCLAPFEVEMYFEHRGNAESLRTIVRFGATDHNGEIQKVSNLKNSSAVIANRPRQNADWAFAVELT